MRSLNLLSLMGTSYRSSHLWDARSHDHVPYPISHIPLPMSRVPWLRTWLPKEQLYQHWNLSKNAKNSTSLRSHTNSLIRPSARFPKRSVCPCRFLRFWSHAKGHGLLHVTSPPIISSHPICPYSVHGRPYTSYLQPLERFLFIRLD
jgi:hypothetical protein